MKLSRKLHRQMEDFFREFFDDENLQLPELEIYANRGADLVTKIISVHGITLGRFIFIRPDLVTRNGSSQLCISKNLLAHEATHVLQYQKLGMPRFLYRYLKSYFGNLRRKKIRNFEARMQAYWDIPFEEEARAGGKGFIDWLDKTQNVKCKVQNQKFSS